MNTKSIRYILGWILNIEALLMLLPVATAVFYREEEGIAYALVVAVCAAVGALLTYKKPKNPGFYAKEGFVCTALGWILMSVFGCLPFMLTGEIPSPVNPPSGCKFHTRCPYAQEICGKEQPPCKTFGDRTVFCHFPLEKEA